MGYTDDNDPDARKLDIEIDLGNSFWYWGMRWSDFGEYQDTGMKWALEYRLEQSGIAGLEGEELLARLLSEDSAGLARALTLSESFQELEVDPVPSHIEFANAEFASAAVRLLVDLEREIFALLTETELRAAPLVVEWRSPSEPTTVLEFSEPIELEPTVIHDAMAAACRERRKTSFICARCGERKPPEHGMSPMPDGKRICQSCSGAVF